MTQQPDASTSYIIDYNIERLKAALDLGNQHAPRYELFEYQNDESNRDYDRKLHCVTIKDREYYIGILHTWGKFFELDPEALIIAVNIFDRIYSEYRIQPEQHICPYQCLRVKAGKRKSSPCRQCTVFKTLVTYDLIICALLMAGKRFFSVDYGYQTDDAAINHLLEILNPKDFLDNVQQISKFKELRKVSYIKQLKVQIARFLSDTALEPTPAYQFFIIFSGILSQHLSSQGQDRAASRLAESHKWIQCVQHKPDVLAMTFLLDEVETIKGSDATKMFQIIKDFLSVTVEEIDACRKTFEICKFEAKNKERQNKIIYLMELVKTSMNFTQSMRRTKSKFKKDFRQTERKQTRGTTSYQGKYPKEQVKLEYPDEKEENYYYNSMKEALQTDVTPSPVETIADISAA